MLYLQEKPKLAFPQSKLSIETSTIKPCIAFPLLSTKVNGFAEYIPKYSLALLPWLSTWPDYGEEYLDDGFGAPAN